LGRFAYSNLVTTSSSSRSQGSQLFELENIQKPGSLSLVFLSLTLKKNETTGAKKNLDVGSDFFNQNIMAFFTWPVVFRA